MAGSNNFTAGNITLTNFIADTTSLNTIPHANSLDPSVTMLIPLGASFDFNWSGNAYDGNTQTNFVTQTEPPQVIGGSGSDAAQLTLQIWTDSKAPGSGGTVEHAGLIFNGATVIAEGTSSFGQTFTLNAPDASTLASELRAVQLVDNTKSDVFQINFTLVDITNPGTVAFAEAFHVAACYASGTRIATPAGETAVEDLQIGDLVRTASGVAKPVKWVGRRSYAAEAVAAARQLRPVIIRKDALGGGLPRRDLVVSPMHALHFDDAFVPASALVNGVSILRRESEGPVEYVHIELQDHDAVLAEGFPAETFVDDDSRAMFDNVSEYYDLYGFADSRRGYSVPRLEEGYRLEAIRRRIAARAGIAPAASVPGEMVGHVERLRDGELEGWIMDRANPANPIELEVLVDGEIVATVLANRYRADLDRAGRADGRCAFSVVMPAAAADIGQVSVRRASDGGQVAMPARTPVAA